MSWKPNLFIPGFPKCGTTALANYLDQHKDIYVIESKEPGTLYHWKKYALFMIPNPNNPHIGKPITMESYKQSFLKHKEKLYRVDASQPYSFDKDFIKDLYKFNPKAKIIIMIRDQIKRTISAYNFTYHIHKLPFDKWLSSILKKDLSTFLYMPYLEELVKYYPKENILVIKQEDLLTNPKQVMNKVFSWLSIEPISIKQSKANVNLFSSNESSLSKKIKTIIITLLSLMLKPFVYLAYKLNLHKSSFYNLLRKYHPLIFAQRLLSRFRLKGSNNYVIPDDLKKILKKDYSKAISFCKKNNILLEL